PVRAFLYKSAKYRVLAKPTVTVLSYILSLVYAFLRPVSVLSIGRNDFFWFVRFSASCVMSCLCRFALLRTHVLAYKHDKGLHVQPEVFPVFIIHAFTYCGAYFLHCAVRVCFHELCVQLVYDDQLIAVIRLLPADTVSHVHHVRQFV